MVVTAQQRHVEPAQPASGEGGELGRQIVCRGEVGEADLAGRVVELDELAQQLLRRFRNGVRGVRLSGGRPLIPLTGTLSAAPSPVDGVSAAVDLVHDRAPTTAASAVPRSAFMCSGREIQNQPRSAGSCVPTSANSCVARHLFMVAPTRPTAAWNDCETLERFRLLRHGDRDHRGGRSCRSDEELFALVRKHTNLPIAAGFGISRPEHMKALRGTADLQWSGARSCTRSTAAETPSHW